MICCCQPVYTSVIKPRHPTTWPPVNSQITSNSPLSSNRVVSQRRRYAFSRLRAVDRDETHLMWNLLSCRAPAACDHLQRLPQRQTHVSSVKTIVYHRNRVPLCLGERHVTCTAAPPSVNCRLLSKIEGWLRGRKTACTEHLRVGGLLAKRHQTKSHQLMISIVCHQSATCLCLFLKASYERRAKRFFLQQFTAFRIILYLNSMNNRTSILKKYEFNNYEMFTAVVPPAVHWTFVQFCKRSSQSISLQITAFGNSIAQLAHVSTSHRKSLVNYRSWNMAGFKDLLWYDWPMTMPSFSGKPFITCALGFWYRRMLVDLFVHTRISSSISKRFTNA